MKLLKGKRLRPALPLGDQPSFSAVYSSAAGQHRLRRSDKGPGKVAPLGECYSPGCNATRLDRGPRFGEDAGVMVANGPS